MTPRSTRNVMIYGAGGHARVCLDVLRADPELDVVAALTDRGDGLEDLGIPVERIGSLEDLTQRSGATTFCVAIGDGAARESITRNLTQSGYTITDVISAAAFVSTTAVLSTGVQILPGAIVIAAARLGDGVIVNTNASVDHDCVVGAFSHVAPGAVVAGGVSIGERTLIGVGARILPGLSVGDDVIVGGGAVVIRDVADGTTVVGNPARPVAGRRSDDGT